MTNWRAALIEGLDGDGNEKSIVVDQDGKLLLSNVDTTRFKEQLTATRQSQFNFKPTWGVSTLRYDTSATTGTGATVGETGGEFRLQTGTTTSNIAQIQTRERGQYQAGAMGEAGIGFRIPTLPTDTQFAEWGYTDFTNGFYFGVDATSPYVAYVTSGSETKTYQADWNVDTLDGNGASGLTLDVAEGIISHIEFTWYGYGDIEFGFYLQRSAGNRIEYFACHRIKIDDSASVVDPNQPLTFRVGNGVTSTTDFSLYIGGHQFSIVDGASAPQKRQVAELLTNYTTATNTNWQPLIAVRKKASLNGRDNSAKIIIDGYEVSADNEMETRLTVNGVTSNLSWASLTGWTSTETGTEAKVTGGTALTTSTDGEPFGYNFVSATKNATVTIDERVSLPLGASNEVILWVRRLSATGAMIVKHAHINLTEEW